MTSSRESTVARRIIEEADRNAAAGSAAVKTDAGPDPARASLALLDRLDRGHPLLGRSRVPAAVDQARVVVALDYDESLPEPAHLAQQVRSSARFGPLGSASRSARSGRLSRSATTASTNGSISLPDRE